MAVKRNAAGGRYIQNPGEYRVRVVETTVKENSKGKPMLTVKFRTADDLEIAGYFTQGVNFHTHNLKELKLAAGLTADRRAEELIGREVGILVETQEPDEKNNGRVFMQITGYDKPESVSSTPPPSQQHQGAAANAPLKDDEVPF